MRDSMFPVNMMLDNFEKMDRMLKVFKAIIDVMSLSTILTEFVREHMKNYDESHDINHVLNVFKNCMIILTNDDTVRETIMPNLNSNSNSNFTRILLIVAFLHDIRDHKYQSTVSDDALNDFLLSIESPENVKIILELIDNVSYSKEVKGLRKTFEEPYQTILNVVSDADRLEALGKVGIVRCEIFTRERGGIVPDDVVKHCHEKLLRLFPGGFFKTNYGNILAYPLHNDIVEYVRNYDDLLYQE